jgi:hypothetical protein
MQDHDMTSGETGEAGGKTITRFVVVALVGLALVGLTVLLTGSKSSLFADQSYVSAPVYADAH